MPIEQLEGRIKGFNNLWNARQNEVIGKEDKLRWCMQDKAKEMAASTGSLPRTVSLPRAHTSIGPYPGCKRNVTLSPRKSAAVHFLEQRLLRADSDSKIKSMRDNIYDGVSAELQGRYKYLRQRAGTSVQSRFGDNPPTTNHTYGFKKPFGEYRASIYCHKPGVETGFNRPNGVVTYTNLPTMRRD
eukprot:TRINITY_DN17653_c0_g1_i1.p2 TRINITY_DN17653_c0_g1~~TRINITY_DN17653_c0_g1_i1.p2  ORF type:complete len:186 (+),score=15.92 TRINITY_DN17653_c0_g1_i1:68-625(+)